MPNTRGLLERALIFHRVFGGVLLVFALERGLEESSKREHDAGLDSFPSSAHGCWNSWL